MSHTANEDRTPTRERAALFLRAAFDALHDAGGGLPLRDIKREVAARVPLTARDREVYEKTGYVRWESILHFYSIDCVKAGFLRKQGGLWQLTPEGEKARQLAPKDMIDQAAKAFRQWKANEGARSGPILDNLAIPERATTEEIVDTAKRSFVFESAEGDAFSEIEQHVRSLNPYAFQELVAALLRAMRYATPFVAPAGPDGGTDVLAYPDPLGAKTPHIRVQVKHRKDKANREEIAALRGIIRGDREIGLFVSSGGFTSDAVREARHGNVHIELMDLGVFLRQWISHYDQVSEEDRALLRLRRVYFLAPE